jgi:hypothetical protein
MEDRRHPTENRQAVTLPEAPVSWNTRYISSQGFECQLTLRGSDAVAVLKVANDLLDKMVSAGVRPVDAAIHSNGNGGHESNGAEDDSKISDVRMRISGGNGGHESNGAEDDPSWCPVHQVHMKRREKDGPAWYSHKAPDGTWCRGG